MANMKVKTPNSPPLLRLHDFKGVNLSTTPTQIDMKQSPDMLNFNIDERGALNKRTGFKRIFDKTLGSGKVNGLYEFRNLGASELLFAHGTKLFKTDQLPGTETLTTWERDNLNDTWESEV